MVPTDEKTMLTAAFAMVLVGVGRAFLRQAAAHWIAWVGQSYVRRLPPDRTVRTSPGLESVRLVFAPDGRPVSPERLWFARRRWRERWGRRATREIAVADATVHDVRLYLRWARSVWLSADDRRIVRATQLRCIDLSDYPDISGPDDGEGATCDPVTPLLTSRK
jgi:hypothetical protein